MYYACNVSGLGRGPERGGGRGTAVVTGLGRGIGVVTGRDLALGTVVPEVVWAVAVVVEAAGEGASLAQPSESLTGTCPVLSPSRRISTLQFLPSPTGLTLAYMNSTNYLFITNCRLQPTTDICELFFPLIWREGDCNSQLTRHLSPYFCKIMFMVSKMKFTLTNRL